MPVLETIFFLVVFGCVLFLAFVTTKYIGAKTSKTMRGKYISIVDTVSLGIDKQLHLVKVADQFVLISSAGKNVDFLTTVKIEQDRSEEGAADNNSFEFRSLFDKYLNNSKFKKSSVDEYDDVAAKQTSSGDAVFRGNLNRLKDITAGAGTDNTTRKGIKSVLDGVDYTNDE